MHIGFYSFYIIDIIYNPSQSFAGGDVAFSYPEYHKFSNPLYGDVAFDSDEDDIQKVPLDAIPEDPSQAQLPNEDAQRDTPEYDYIGVQHSGPSSKEQSNLYVTIPALRNENGD